MLKPISGNDQDASKIVAHDKKVPKVSGLSS